MPQLKQRREEMMALVGRQAQFDASIFTGADEQEIVTGRIKSMRLVEGRMLKKKLIEPHWRVSIETGENSRSEVAYLHVTVLPKYPEEQ